MNYSYPENGITFILICFNTNVARFTISLEEELQNLLPYLRQTYTNIIYQAALMITIFGKR